MLGWGPVKSQISCSVSTANVLSLLMRSLCSLTSWLGAIILEDEPVFFSRITAATRTDGNNAIDAYKTWSPFNCTLENEKACWCWLHVQCVIPSRPLLGFAFPVGTWRVRPHQSLCKARSTVHCWGWESRQLQTNHQKTRWSIRDRQLRHHVQHWRKFRSLKRRLIRGRNELALVLDIFVQQLSDDRIFRAPVT